MNKISDISQFAQGSEISLFQDQTAPATQRPLRGSLFCAVALPPPLHGQSLVNDCVVGAARRLAGADQIEVADIGPGSGTSGVRYHLTRIARVARACALMARGGFGRDRRLYTVFESGYGVVYNFMLIGLARLLGYSVVLHHHTSQHTFEHQARFALLQRLAGRSCLHVVLSKQMARNLGELYPAVERILVSPNACHIPERVIEARPRRERLRVGFLSNLCFEKGLDVVISAAAICHERGLNVTFVVAGPAVDRESEDLLADARTKLGDHIEIVGPVRDEAKDAFFRSIDLFLFPTRYRFEAQPLVALEAMSYGLPVIATRRGYVAELLGKHGVVLEARETLPGLIVERLEKWLADNEYSYVKSIETKLYFSDLRAEALGQLDQLLDELLCGSRRKVLEGAPAR